MSRVTKRRENPVLREHIINVNRLRIWLYQATDAAVERWLARPRIGDTRPGTPRVVFKPREHFRDDGQPKAKRTLAEAQRFCQQHPEARFYVCSRCGAYHVGHRLRSERPNALGDTSSLAS